MKKFRFFLGLIALALAGCSSPEKDLTQDVSHPGLNLFPDLNNRRAQGQSTREKTETFSYFPGQHSVSGHRFLQPHFAWNLLRIARRPRNRAPNQRFKNRILPGPGVMRRNADEDFSFAALERPDERAIGAFDIRRGENLHAIRVPNHRPNWPM